MIEHMGWAEVGLPLQRGQKRASLWVYVLGFGGWGGEKGSRGNSKCEDPDTGQSFGVCLRQKEALWLQHRDAGRVAEG